MSTLGDTCGRGFQRRSEDEKVKGVNTSLAIVSPFVDGNAMEDAEALGIPVFTRLSL